MTNQTNSSEMEQDVRKLKIAALTKKLKSKNFQKILGIIAILIGVILINQAGNLDTDFGKIGLVIIVAGIISIVIGFKGNSALKSELTNLEKQ